jgi:archaemetzincin
MRIILIPLIDFPIPFAEINSIFPYKLDLSISDRKTAELIKKKLEKGNYSNAVEILRELSKIVSEKDHYLILTDKEIRYGNKTILGLSEFKGNSIVSIYLIKNESNLQKEEEAIKVILHEIGHGIGLKHCKVKECIMSRLETIEDLRRQRLDFCNDCKNKTKKLKNNVNANKLK